MKNEYFVIKCANKTETMIFFNEIMPCPVAAHPESCSVFVFKEDVDDEKRNKDMDSMTKLVNRAERITKNFFLKKPPIITSEKLEHTTVFPDDEL